MTQLERNGNRSISKGTAFKFVISLGVVSLFADMTYEGARSITGPSWHFLEQVER